MPKRLSSTTAHHRTPTPRPADEPIEVCCLVADVRMRLGRKRRPYQALTLRDGRQEIRAYAHADCQRVRSGQTVRIAGYLRPVKGEPAIAIRTLELVDAASRQETHPLKSDLDRLCTLISQIAPPYREVVDRVVGDTARWARFCRAPASTDHHHAYPGGLLRHTIEVMELGRGLLPLLSRDIDPSLLLAAGLFHDLGKCETYTDQPPFALTSRGKRFGHELLGLWVLLPVLEQTASLSPEACSRLLVTLHLTPGRYDSPISQEQEVLTILDGLSVQLSQTGRLMAA